MITDYAPRLAARASVRKRRHVLFTLCLLMLPALSFHPTHRAADTTATSPVQVAQDVR